MLIADGLELPLGAITESIAILARKGAGKTYTGTKLFELFAGAGAQCVALDPVGNWWGLRLAADGKRPGIDVPIFGGVHGDMPLLANAGALMARVIVERGLSAVLDVSDFEQADMKRFVTAFAVELFQLKKRDHAVMHLFLEEASTFVPQDKEDGRDLPMLSAFKQIIRKGRNYGIGVSLIDQRPQDVNKKVLNQTEILFALQLTGAHELDTISRWVREKKIDGDKLVDEIAKFEQGEAYLWSPALLRLFRRVKVLPRWTFNASKTPELGEKPAERRPLRKLELEELKASMSSMLEQADQEDPERLRARVGELEKKLAAAGVSGVRQIGELSRELEVARRSVRTIPMLTPVQMVALSETAGAVVDLIESTRELGQVIHSVLNAHNEAAIRMAGLPPVVLPQGPVRLIEEAPAAAPTHYTPATAKPGDPPKRRREELERITRTLDERKIDRSAFAILEALAMFHPESRTRAQVATLTGIGAKGSSMRKYLGQLRGGHLVEGGPDELRATPRGLAIVGAVPRPRTTEELLALWLPKFDGGAGLILRRLVQVYPRTVDRELLARELGMEPKGSSMRKYLGALRSAGLVNKGEPLTASGTLFP